MPAASVTATRQSLAAIELARGASPSTAALRAGCHRTTVQRWLRSRQFLLLLSRERTRFVNAYRRAVDAALARQLADDVKHRRVDAAAALRIYAEAAGRNTDA